MALDEVKVKTLRTIMMATGLAASALVLLAGCGRKADLDPPSMPADQQNKRTAKPQEAAPDRPFILDPLL